MRYIRKNLDPLGSLLPIIFFFNLLYQLGSRGTHSSTSSAWMSFLHMWTFSYVCTSVTILFSCWVKWWTLDLYYNFSSQAQVTATCLSWLVCMSLMRYLPCDLWVQIFILQFHLFHLHLTIYDPRDFDSGCLVVDSNPPDYSLQNDTLADRRGPWICPNGVPPWSIASK